VLYIAANNWILRLQTRTSGPPPRRLGDSRR
jgi:hypothetical protein